MKICYVVDNLDTRAGWGRLAWRIGEGVRSSGHEVSYVCEGSDDTVSQANVTYTKLTGFGWKNILELFQSLGVLRREVRKADLVISYDTNPYGILTVLASLGTDTKVAIYSMGTYSLFDPSGSVGAFLRNQLMKFAYEKVVCTIIVTDFVKRKIEQYGYQLPKTMIIPPGVDISGYSPRKESLENVSKPYIVTVGAIKQRKGYHLSLEAFGLLQDEFPRLTYVIRGDVDDPGYTRELEERARELGISDRVVFLPRIDEESLARLYSHAELFIMSSTSTANYVEGFGMVYVEAGACGIPVVGALDSGAEAAIEDGVTGFLTEPNPNALAEAMRKILSDSDLRAHMGTAGIKHATKFDWGKLTEDHIRCYKTLIDEVNDGETNRKLHESVD